MKQITIAVFAGLSCSLAGGATSGPMLAQTYFEAVEQKKCSLLLKSIENRSGIFFEGTSPPSNLAWTKRLDQNCLVYDQGDTNSCYLHAGTTAIELTLRKLGLLNANENISREYYMTLYARDAVKSNAERAEYWQNPNYWDYDSFLLDQGGYLFYFAKRVEKFGVVTTDQFQFDLSLKRVFFEKDVTIKAMDQVRRSGADLETRLRAFDLLFGKPLEISPLLSGSEMARLKLFRETSYNVTSMKFNLETGVYLDDGSMERMLAEVKRTIDLGISPLDSVYRNHSVSILGYKEDPISQEITHLLILNSYGEKIGEGGYIAVDRNFIKKYFRRVQTLKPEINLNQKRSASENSTAPPPLYLKKTSLNWANPGTARQKN